MSTFDPNSVNWHDGLLSGWRYDKPVRKWFQGGFRNAHRITRECPTCAGTYAIEVTTAALLGSAANHGLALRRCKACRAALKRGGVEYAARKEQDGTGADISELERLRAANATMKEELSGLYARNKELTEKLSLYEPKKMPWEA